MRTAKYDRAVLERIAAIEQVAPGSLSLGEKGAVFYRCGSDLRCLCQKGSDYWNTIEADVIAFLAIKRAARM